MNNPQRLHPLHLAMVVLCCCLVMKAEAATYYSRATGNWNSNTTWSLSSGGAAVGVGVFPVAGDIVNIERNFTVTVTAAASCAAINFNVPVASTTTRLTINTGVVLSVSGAVTLNASASANTVFNIGGAGTLNAASVNLGGSTNLNPGATWTVTLNLTLTAFNVTGNFDFNGWRGNQNTRRTDPTLNVTSGTLNIDGQVTFTSENNVSIATLTLGNTSPTLLLSNATPFPASASVFNLNFNGTGATVNYDGANNQTVIGEVYTNLNASGSGIKTLDAASTVGGSLTVDAGVTLDLAGFALGSPTSTTLNCGAASGSAITGTGTLSLGGNIIVNDAGTGSSGASISCPVSLVANRSFTVADDGTTASDLAVTGIISGVGFGITKAGAGTMVLSANNSYSGATTVTAGTLRASTNNVVASATGAFGNNPSALNLNGGAIESDVATFSRPITITATGSRLDAYGAARTISSTINKSAAGTFDLNLGGTTAANAEGQALTLSGVISNSTATLRLVKTGTSEVILTGNNTFTGSTSINDGRLTINADASLGTAPGAATPGHLNIGAGILATTTTFTLATTRGIALTAAGATIDVAASTTLSYAGIAAGTNGLAKDGAGTLTLSGTNSFSGGFTLNNGQVNINNSQALGTAAGTFTINNGTIDNTTAGAITTVNYPMAWNSDFTFVGTQNLNLGSAAVTLSASRQVTVSASTLTVGGSINHSTLNLTKAGAGILLFGSQVITLQDLIVSAGTLTSTSGNLNIAGALTNAGTFNHNNGTVVFTKVSGGQSITPLTYYNLTLANTSGVNNAGGGIAVANTFTTTAGGIFDMGTDTLAVTNVTHAGILRTQNTSTAPITANKTWGGTVEFNRTNGNQDIVAGTYANLTSGNSANTNLVTGDITVNGVFTIAAGGTVNMALNTLTGTGFSTSGTGTLRTRENSATPLPANATWSFEVEYYRSGNQSVVPGTYSSLTTSGSGTKTMTGNITVTSGLTLTAATLTTGSNTLTLQTNAITNTTGTLNVNTGTVVFDLSGTVNLPNSFFSALPANNLTITGGATVQLAKVPTKQTFQGTVNISNGKLALADSATLVIGGAVTNLSAANSIVGKSTASIELIGPVATGTLFFDQSVPGTSNLIENLIVNKVDLNGTVSFGNTLKVRGVLTPTAGTVTSNGNIAIASDIAGSGRIYPAINPAVFQFIGGISIERYVRSKNLRKFMFVSTPVDGVSIRDAWQDDIFITGPGTGGTACGAGTGNGGATDRFNSNGFDATVANNVSIYTYDQNVAARWVAVPNTATTLVKGKGYRVLFRGSRGLNDANCSDYLMLNNPSSPSTSTMNVTGTPTTGDVFVQIDGPTTGAFGYTLLGNPYACEIDFTQFRSQNNNKIAATYWTYDPNGSDNNTSYLTVNNGTVVGGYHSGADPNDYPNPHLIASGQAFFVQADSDTTLRFTESQKVSQNQPGVFRSQNTWNSKIRIHFKQADNTFIDNVVVRFSNEPTVTVAESKEWDAITFNAGNFLATIKGNRSFAIQTRPLNFFNDTVLVRVVSSTTGNFKLTFSDFGNFTEAAQIILLDLFTGTQTDVKANPSYPFTITSNAATQGGRFKLVFRSTASVMPLSFLSITAASKDKGVNVNWKVAFEQNVIKYQVERSRNGKDFEPAGEVVSKGNSNMPVDYAFFDAAPFNGTSYYRVKSVEAGEGQYSEVVKVNSSRRQAVLSLYPNPVSDKLKLTIYDFKDPRATITITNAQGKTVMHMMSTTTNGYVIDVSNLPNGMYFLSITGVNGENMMEKFIKY